jgi:hypothetical protein
MTIQLSPDVETRLQEEARRRGLDPAAYAARLIDAGLPRTGSEVPAHPDQATLDLLKRMQDEDATDDPGEIARREREFEEFKAAMNQNRLDMEGPDARKIYP